MSVLQLNSVSAGYPGKLVLDNVNLEVAANDFIGIIGSNGSGKTTLVKAILGLIPYSGSITYTAGVSEPGKIGYLPQQSNFDRNFPISVRQVILSGLQSKKVSARTTPDDIEKLERLLQLTGIKNLENRQIGELSGGELQRTLLCRALISEPKILILDEPANSVDSEFEIELYEILHKLNEEIAILMVSHDIGTITSYVKSIVCVEGGTLHRHENPKVAAPPDHPLQFVSHEKIPYTVLSEHQDGQKDCKCKGQE